MDDWKSIAQALTKQADEYRERIEQLETELTDKKEAITELLKEVHWYQRNSSRAPPEDKI